MKIAIVVPNTGIMRSETAINLASMILYSSKTFTSITMSAPQGRVEQNRNQGAQVAIDNDCEYLMFIDADMTFPMNTATKLLQHDKDIVGCNAAKRISGKPVLTHDVEGKELKEGLSEVSTLSFAVALIKTEVFKSIAYPWFYSPIIEDGIIAACDMNLCVLARGSGFSCYCDNDLSKEIGHLSTINRFMEN